MRACRAYVGVLCVRVRVPRAVCACPLHTWTSSTMRILCCAMLTMYASSPYGKLSASISIPSRPANDSKATMTVEFVAR